MTLNHHYTEKRLGAYANEVGYDLSLQVSGIQFIPYQKIQVSSNGIKYDAFEQNELNSVRTVLLLLMIAISDYDNELLQDRGVVQVPESMVLTETPLTEGGDLLGHIPLTEKGYCLYLAYQKLSNKLSERNTPLFRVLFMCVCLEAWRQNIPPRVIVGIAGNDVHWGALISQLTNGFSDNATRGLQVAGYGGFIHALQAALETISKEEIPDNILRHYYSQGKPQANDVASIVGGYLNDIMRESRVSLK